MLRPARLLLVCSLLTLCCLSLALGQEMSKHPSTKTQIVTASVARDHVRISAPSAVVQIRLEVYDDAGQKLFDTEQRAGNVLDWHLQGTAGARVADGTYLCVVTIKNPSGQLTQKLGLVTVNALSTTLRPAGIAELSLRQAQVAGPIEGEDQGLAVMPAEEAQPVTVLAHTGEEAQLARSRGALSFRVGDFFSGNDKEQMRLTEDGRLGIGNDNPQATLDVAGTIRAGDGILFADGTVLKSASEIGAGGTGAARNNTATTNLAGTGTANRVVKWADSSGTLIDSALSDVGGNIGVGTMTPTYKMVVGPDVGPGLTTSDLTVSRGAGQSVSIFAGATGAQGMNFGWDQSNQRAFVNAPVQSPITFTHGGVSERLRIETNGNVGIGTTNPAARLDVTGNIKLSGANNGLIFPDGTKMTTAGSGGTMSGTSIVNAINDPATDVAISETRLSANVPRLNANNFFSTNQTVNGNVTAAGRLESNSGGIKFPDGSVQTSAAGKTYTTVVFNELEIGKPIAEPGGGVVTILQLNLPAGTYMITASVQFENKGLFNKRMVAFQMINEATWFFRIEGSGGAMDQIPITMHTVLNHSGGVVKVDCMATDGGGRSNIFAKARRLTAMRLADLVIQ
jgi:hypothetical protein